MNHERYKDPTAEQAIAWVQRNTRKSIKKLKREKCQFCVYASGSGTTRSDLERLTCDYILKTGRPRGCSPDRCNKFKKWKSKGE